MRPQLRKELLVSEQEGQNKRCPICAQDQRTTYLEILVNDYSKRLFRLEAKVFPGHSYFCNGAESDGEVTPKNKRARN